jgi:hypothetical protein
MANKALLCRGKGSSLNSAQPVDIVLCSSLPDLAALERLFEKQADKVRFVDSQHADLAPTEIEAAAGGTVSGFFLPSDQTWLGGA